MVAWRGALGKHLILNIIMPLLLWLVLQLQQYVSCLLNLSKSIIWPVLVYVPSYFCLQETFIIEKDGQECSSQSERLSHRTGKEANQHADVMCNRCSSELPDHGVTEMCQRVLCNILTSEKFRSLCKALLQNFQGMKPESVFDFAIMNLRMKEQAYDQSPALFLSDMQQVNYAVSFYVVIGTI